MSTTHDEVDSASGQPPKRDGLERLGPYRIERRLGAGGMGTVYLAFDEKLKRQVALKVLPKEKATNQNLVKRFQSEAQKAAQLKHENIVDVYDAGDIDGLCYIALEYIDGIDVHELVNRRGVLPLKRSIDVVRQVALALQHAFERGIVHRDIKPSNLLIRRDGLVKLADMGLARSIDDTIETGITRAGTTVGTVDYMSPEQATDSKAADTRSDVYSLGCTWYHMLTGQPPFPQGSLSNKLAAHARSNPPDPRVLNPRVTEGVVAIMHQMMAKQPEKRYQTPRDLLDDLESGQLSKDSVAKKILDAIVDEDEGAPKLSRSPIQEDPQEDEYVPGRGNQEQSPLPTKGKTPPKTKANKEQQQRKAQNKKDSPETKKPSPSGKKTSTEELENESDTESPQSESDAPEQAKSKKKRGLPPRADGKALTSEKLSLDWKVIWYGLGGLAIVGSVVVLGYIISLYAQGIDVPHGTNQVEQIGGENKNPIPPMIGNQGNQNSKKPDNIVVVEEGPANGANRPTRPDTRSPHWAARQQREAPYLPGWALEPAPDLPILLVDPEEKIENSYPSISRALENLSETGGLLELHGSGPFDLPPITLDRKGTIILRAAGSTRPLVRLIPGENEPASGHVNLMGTTLWFDRVDLGFSTAELSTGTVININQGDLLLHESSISALGTPDRPLTLIEISGGATRHSRFFLRNSLLQAQNATLVQIGSAKLDAAVQNSLLLAPGGTAWRWEEQKTGIAQTDRTLALLSTTLWGTTGMSLESAPNSPPAHTRVTVLNSVLSASENSESQLFLVRGWQENNIRQAATGPLANFRLSLNNSLIAGFGRYVSGLRSNELIDSPDKWLKYWQDNVPLETFLSGNWPKTGNIQLGLIPLDTWYSDSIQGNKLKTPEGDYPGCALDALKAPDLGPLLKVAGGIVRPVPPPPLPQGKVIAVDLAKDDLPKLLSGNWASPATFRVKGSGIKELGAILIEGKSCRIVFEQSGTESLILRPKFRVDGVATGTPWFTVRGGRMEIENAHLQLLASEKDPGPAYVVQGAVTLKHCKIAGPLTEKTRLLGLLQLSGSGETSLIQNSVLMGPGRLVDILGAHQLVIRNSLLVGTNIGINIERASSSQTGEVAIDLERTTISAQESIFRAVDPSALETSPPIKFFSRESVFGPPLPGGKGPASLMTCSEALLGSKKLFWWEDSCGHSPANAILLNRLGGPASLREFEKEWVPLWKASNVIHPALGAKGVMLKTPLPERGPYPASLFIWHENSDASKWSSRQGPIGADGQMLDESTGPQKESKPEKTKSKTQEPKPGF